MNQRPKRLPFPVGKYLIPNALVIFCAVFVPSCSGGGGGGGGSGRTTETAVRVVHGALSASPVSLLVDETEGEVAQNGRFGEATQYFPVGNGERTLILQRANSPDVFVGSIAATLEKNTEYSLFVLDTEVPGRVTLSLVTDTVTQPEMTRSLFRVMNAYRGARTVTVSGPDISSGALDYGGVSDFLDLPNGPRTLRAVDSNGRELSSRLVDFPDRGEVTVLVSGSEELGVSFLTVYTDLD